MRRTLLVLLALALLVLHQDFWNWGQTDPIVFGFLPIGLAYHAAYCIACSIMMWLMVRFLWPKHLEELENRSGPSQGEGH